MKTLVRIFNTIHIFMVHFAKLLLVAMTGIIAAHVFMRYVLRAGIHSSEGSALFVSAAVGRISSCSFPTC